MNSQRKGFLTSSVIILTMVFTLGSILVSYSTITGSLFNYSYYDMRYKNKEEFLKRAQWFLKDNFDSPMDLYNYLMESKIRIIYEEKGEKNLSLMFFSLKKSLLSSSKAEDILELYIEEKGEVTLRDTLFLPLNSDFELILLGA